MRAAIAIAALALAVAGCGSTTTTVIERTSASPAPTVTQTVTERPAPGPTVTKTAPATQTGQGALECAEQESAYKAAMYDFMETHEVTGPSASQLYALIPNSADGFTGPAEPACASLEIAGYPVG